MFKNKTNKEKYFLRTILKNIFSICFIFNGLNNAISQNLEKAFANTITTCQLKEHLSILAHDSLEGRATGTKGQLIAANYVANKFTEYGLLPFYTPKDNESPYFQNYYVEKLRIFGGNRSKARLTEADPKNAKLIKTQNVVGYITGSEFPNEFIVISAHLDHIGINDNGQINNGADDDGSGSVALLELAKAFGMAKKLGYGPKRSIVFLNVTGEEMGLLGSEHFVNTSPIPLKNIVCNLNIDMIGRSDMAHKNVENYVYLIGSDRLSSKLHEVSEATNKEHDNLELNYTFNSENDPNQFYYRSDHYNFAKNGIPVIFYFRGVHPDYHQPGDDVEKIEFEALKKVAQLVFYTCWKVANMAERIKAD